jgi:type IV secretion system protein VirB5
MNTRSVLALGLIFCAVSLTVTPAAKAQWVVIDPAALTQLLIQVQQTAQDIAIAESTLNQTKQMYGAMTGNRGMQSLLSGINRNYLPANWSQLNGAMSGAASGTYGALGSDVSSTVTRNSVLTPTQVSALSPSEQDAINKQRRAVALLEALSRAALTNTSNRFHSIQTLINAIPTAVDQKGALDLHARIGAEQGMLANEQTKMGELYKSAEVAAATARMRADEQAIADIGSLQKLPPMGLN